MPMYGNTGLRLQSVLLFAPTIIEADMNKNGEEIGTQDAHSILSVHLHGGIKALQEAVAHPDTVAEGTEAGACHAALSGIAAVVGIVLRAQDEAVVHWMTRSQR